MDSARDILPFVYRLGEPDEERDFDLIASYWTAAVGRRVALHARPVFFRQGRLTVEVDGPEWLTQLESLAAQIRGRLNDELGSTMVGYILFRTAGQRKFGPGRASSSQGRGDQEVRNPIRRRLYLDSKKAQGE